MSETINAHVAWYEFRWLAAIGMITFLMSAAVGSPVLMLGGIMTWGGFSMLAARFPRPAPGRMTLAGTSASAGLKPARNRSVPASRRTI